VIIKMEDKRQELYSNWWENWNKLFSHFIMIRRKDNIGMGEALVCKSNIQG
jgi:hypothetical protein